CAEASQTFVFAADDIVENVFRSNLDQDSVWITIDDGSYRTRPPDCAEDMAVQAGHEIFRTGIDEKLSIAVWQIRPPGRQPLRFLQNGTERIRCRTKYPGMHRQTGIDDARLNERLILEPRGRGLNSTCFAPDDEMIARKFDREIGRAGS